ncbi:MAG: hypothetical protein ACK4NA_13070 [Alphaproteobacteria bacterium]
MCGENDNDNGRMVSLGFEARAVPQAMHPSCFYDALIAHPIMLVRGQAMRNPCYVPPKRYLAAHGGK